MYAYDIETFIDDKKFIPFCVSLGNNDKIVSFYSKNCVRDSIEYLINLNSNLIVYIHNINFDGYFILNSLLPNEYLCDISLINNKIYMIKIRLNNSCSVEWRCSYNLIPLSLEKIGNSYFDRKKMPFPYHLLEKKISDDYILTDSDFNGLDLITPLKEGISFKDYTIKYCENDVRLTLDLINLYYESIKNLDISKNDFLKSYTHSSLMIRFFYKKKNNFKIEKKISENIDFYIRKSYYGGRCEVYGNPKNNEKTYHFDFPGMYGLCMNEKFPIGRGYFSNKKEINYGFYYVKWYFNPKLESYPVLPIKCDIRGKLMFYCGYGEGLYWYEEILLHIKVGGEIIEIYSSYEFENSEYVFKEYIGEMTEIRNRGGVYKTIGKLGINSIYGRLGMGYESEKGEIVGNGSLEDGYERIINLKNLKIGISKVNERRDFTNIIYSSIITSKARIKLYNAQRSLLDKGFRILYSDTDSIFFASKSLIKNCKIGEIDINNDYNNQFLDCVFAQPKTYAILKKNKDEIVKIKGFNDESIKFNEFKEKFFKNESINTFKNINIRRKNLNLFYEKDVHKKTDLAINDKRIWIDNKTSTKTIYRCDKS